MFVWTFNHTFLFGSNKAVPIDPMKHIFTCTPVSTSNCISIHDEQRQTTRVAADSL